MREYGQIQCAFWQSDDAQAFTDAGKLLAAYLMTGPHSNGIGCYRCPDGYVMEDLGWSSERVSEGFAELSRNGFAYRFGGVVFLPKFLAWNKVANGNVAKARLAEFWALPKGEAKSLAAQALMRFCGHLTREDREALETVCQTVSETVTQTETNPTQPYPTLPKPSSSLRSDDSHSPESGELPAAGKEPATVREHPASERLFAAVLESYHRRLPRCLRIAVLNPKRRKRILAADKLARQVCREQGWPYEPAGFWDAYFAECEADPWMRGEVANPRNPAWKQNLDVLLAEDRFAGIMDRAIDTLRREAAA